MQTIEVNTLATKENDRSRLIVAGKKCKIITTNSEIKLLNNYCNSNLVYYNMQEVISN